MDDVIDGPMTIVAPLAVLAAESMGSPVVHLSSAVLAIMDSLNDMNTYKNLEKHETIILVYIYNHTKQSILISNCR